MMYSYISFIAKYNKDNYSFKKELEILEQKNKDNNTKTILFITSQFNIVGIIIGISKQSISFLVKNLFDDFNIIIKSKIDLLGINVDINLDNITLLFENLDEDFCLFKNIIVDSLVKSISTQIEITDIFSNKIQVADIDKQLNPDIDINFLKIRNQLKMIEEKANKSYAKIFEGNGSSILSKLAKLEEQQIQDDKEINRLKEDVKKIVGVDNFNIMNMFLNSDKKQLFTFLFILIIIISASQIYLVPKIKILVEEATKEVLKP